MSRRRTSNRDYAKLKEASGWYMAAWRDYRGISQDELAAEIDTSKSMVSDLERGEKPFGPKWLGPVAKALGVTQGYLIERNPFEFDAETNAFVLDFEKLDERGREMVRSQLAAALASRPR